MALSAESQAVASAVAKVLPQPMHTLGVKGAREFANTVRGNAQSGPDVASVEDRHIDGPCGPIPIRIFRPNTSINLPVLVYFHGGGWVVGLMEGVESNCRKMCLGANLIVVSVGYHQAPEHKFPAAANDACYAVDWVLNNGREFGADTSRTAVGGESAGANLATVAALHARDTDKALRFQFLVTPPTDYPADQPSYIENANAPVLTTADMLWFTEQYLRSETDRVDPRFAPSQAEDLSGLAPAFILTAEHDPVRDDSEQYARLLTAAGVSVFLKRYPGVFHGFFGMSGTIPQADEAMLDAIALLRRHLTD